MLKSDDAKVVDLKSQKNYLNYLEGKDFYHLVDNGFKQHAIKNSKLAKIKNKSLYFMQQMKDDVNDAIKSVESQIKSKTISSAEKRRKKITLQVLKEKLLEKINVNINALKEGDMSLLEEASESGAPILIERFGLITHINA